MSDVQDPRTQLRVVRHFSGGARTLARLDLSDPQAAQRLSDVTNDWLYALAGDEGKRKLLREHQLLAA